MCARVDEDCGISCLSLFMMRHDRCSLHNLYFGGLTAKWKCYCSSCRNSAANFYIFTLLLHLPTSPSLLIPGYHRLFSWPTYLAETGSRAVPASAFKAVPFHSAFKKGMKVEVVDRRNPILVRVATIADVLLRQIKVSEGSDTVILAYYDSSVEHCVKSANVMVKFIYKD